MFQDSFNKILSQQLTHDRSYISVSNAWLYPFPKRQILDSSKQKDFADDNFIFDENGRKFFKSLKKKKKTTVEKGEIAHYEQFLLFLQCFPKTCTADT